MMQRAIQRLQSISLKWKLLIPFLFFAFAGTSTLTIIGLTSQQRLIKAEERKMLLLHYRNFHNEMDQKGRQAASMASIVAENKDVQRLLLERDREGLNDLLVHTYVRLKVDYDISQFHFHVPPGISFLRLNAPTMYGDDLRSYRMTIQDAIKRCRSVWGLAMGETGFGIRGVVPVFSGTKLAGTVEIGHSFGESFLKGLHRRWNIDLVLYGRTRKGTFEPMASVFGDKTRSAPANLDPAMAKREEPTILISPPAFPDRAVLLGPVKSYSGDVVAAVEISTDRSRIRQRLETTRNLMILVGAAGIAVSFLLTYMVAFLFIRPIKGIVREAQEIAEEKRDSYLDPGLGDEIGTLTNALNRMLAALMERRIQIEEYAKNLERRVDERTADLVASEEKFRTLVENVPLIVYRIHEDGTTEFVNSYLTEILGYDIEEAVGNRDFWCSKILNNEEAAFGSFIQSCVMDKGGCYIERVVRDKEGRPLVFLDHAIPATDEAGQVLWIDGIMLDITELKQLQERAMRTEEIRILGEISARMAHEIRNPLSVAGGFARRLRDALPEGDRNRKMADIIMNEMARMETFVGVLLTSIRRFDLAISEVEINRILRSCIKRTEELARARNVRVREDLDLRLPRMSGDEDRLNQALDSLIRHAIVSMPEGDTLDVMTREEDDHIVIRLTFLGSRVSDDDLEQFFFPHLEEDPNMSVLDLPLSKIIIHRHGGGVDVFREADRLITEVRLPIQGIQESQG